MFALAPKQNENKRANRPWGQGAIDVRAQVRYNSQAHQLRLVPTGNQLACFHSSDETKRTYRYYYGYFKLIKQQILFRFSLFHSLFILHSTLFIFHFSFFIFHFSFFIFHFSFFIFIFIYFSCWLIFISLFHYFMI